jgi:NAD(P)-dependent dehydrogenase (short-subunit alcohol dehydrogenase family)
MSLTGKIFIVTGGARGLGLAMVRGLLAADAGVAAADLPDAGHELNALCDWARENGKADRLATIFADVTDPSQCRKAIDTTMRRMGGLHGIINNAGRLVPRPMKSSQIDPGLWRSIVDVNVNGPFFMMQAAAPVLLAQGWGRIINVVTSRSTLAREGFGPYGPSKAALEAATLLWAREFAGSGVTVNAVLPGGGTDTRLARGVMGPDAKLMPPDVIVPPVLWLCSTDADGVSGKRYVASAWDAALPPRAAADRASETVAW